MRNYFKRSVKKFEPHVINEDAAMAKRDIVAVADGAGGGGVYAERWSKYLLKQLPKAPITSFKALDDWVDEIWEPFYNECERDAKAMGGMFLDKFYDEGSFTTLAAAWRVGEKEWEWMTYGDSVVFCYDQKEGLLNYSPIRLADFNRAPYLISDKDPLKPNGFQHGSFATTNNCVVFAATDAVAHYILMMYDAANKDEYSDELKAAVEAKTKNSNFVETALSMKSSFPRKLARLLTRSRTLRTELKRLERAGLLGHDDYSIAVNECRG